MRSGCRAGLRSRRDGMAHGVYRYGDRTVLGVLAMIEAQLDASGRVWIDAVGERWNPQDWINVQTFG